MSVKPIPEGMEALIPHITVSSAKDAIEFYKKAFGAKELMRSNTPDGRIMHAALMIGKAHMMLNDYFPEMGGCAGPAPGTGMPFVINLYVEDADETFKRATAAGATVKMPLSNMFWGDRYGHLEDPFGYRWAICTHLEDVAPDEIKRRADAMFSQPAHQ